MHLLTNTAPIDPKTPLMGILAPGEWLMHDQNAFEFALMAERGTVELAGIRRIDRNASFDPVLIVRSGAFGDLLLASPAIRAFREKRPDREVVLSCFDIRRQLFEHTDLFDGFADYPLPYSEIANYSEIISLENVIETAHDKHATDAFAEALGVTVTDYKPVNVVTPEEKETARARWQRNRPLVGIQLRASVRNRDYPAALWSKVILELENRGWDVLLFGSKGQIPPLPPEMRRTYIRDLSQHDLTFRETCAALANCAAFAGVDSALIHVCHALDIPAVGLYGPFPWQIRTAHAPKTEALTGTGACAGCCWHAKLGQHFPPGQPCYEKQICWVLATIPPERIVSKIDAMKP